ncbi:MAG: TIGR01777 family oxidoreductase [Ramlibacter sp.]
MDSPAGPQHLLVTGGTGFIGRHLVAQLLGQGHRVTVLTRRELLPAAMAHPQLRACTRLEQIGTADAVDAVVNLAGARILGVPWTQARRQALLDSRVAFTQRLVRWIAGLQARPRILVSGSAIGYYGVQADGDDRVLTEADGPQPVFMSDLCRQWEEAAGEAVRHGVQVACLRFGLVLGHGGALPMMLLPVRLGLAGRLGSGRQWMSWVHVEDVVRAIGHTLQTPQRVAVAGNAYNVTAPEAVRQIDFNCAAARVLHRPCVLPAPAWPLRLLLGEQSQLLLDGQRVAPARLESEGFAFRHPGLQAALQQLLKG